MQKQIIECVPNFSEGVDMNIIQQITDEIKKIEGVTLLDVDPGKATNRTVVTFVGEPQPVIDAAFQAIKKASELIDMSMHKGEHPRMGATDVCPLIPISGITMEETVVYAKKLGKRVGEELHIPVYLYENAAQQADRQNLATIRAGEYEGFADKIKDPHWVPDFGEAVFNVRSGATVIGARDFLVAYNVNLNTISTRRANSVAFDLRENGRVKELNGKKVIDELGVEVREPGLLKSVKAIGWFIEEYGIAQISMNLTNINITPLHIAFDTAVERAHARGMRVTGSELVGLVPLKSMIDAGKYFLQKQRRSVGVSEEEIIRIAIKSMGLDELTPFDPKKKIIEYVMNDGQAKRLIDMNLVAFANETASESPAPGGGSISAYVASLGASLGTMVANLSSHKKGWDAQIETFSAWAEKGQTLKDDLLKLVDEDTLAFSKIMDAFSLPKNTDDEKQARSKAIQEATLYATEVPLLTMKKSVACYPLIREMVNIGNPNSLSDAAVGALCIRAAVYGAYLNVKINAGGLKDKTIAEAMVQEAKELLAMSNQEEADILKMTEEKMG
ncbi:MAG: glutamate formimidoyltransferase [Bacteroidetes bacterium]|nr:glutamate formimidoyltransferase [Bacteroidota bacterium]